MPGGLEPSKLLVADRQLAHAESLAAFLSQHGFDTRAVSDGGEAILLAEAWPADAAVLSLPLGDISGLDVARHLRQSFGSSFRLVACSPDADSEWLHRLAHVGFDDVVPASEPQSILAALTGTTRALVERSMRQTVKRIELLIVLGHSFLGLREQAAVSTTAIARVARIVALVSRDIALVEPAKERERLQREFGALAERVPDPRIVRF